MLLATDHYHHDLHAGKEISATEQNKVQAQAAIMVSLLDITAPNKLVASNSVISKRQDCMLWWG